MPHAVTSAIGYLYNTNPKLLTVSDGFGSSGREQLKSQAAKYGIHLVVDDTFGPKDTETTLRAALADPQNQAGWDTFWKAADTFPARFNAFFNDNFGFRRSMLRLNGFVTYAGFPTQSDALVGKDGWLYLNSYNALEAYRATTPMTPMATPPRPGTAVNEALRAIVSRMNSTTNSKTTNSKTMRMKAADMMPMGRCARRVRTKTSTVASRLAWPRATPKSQKLNPR